MAGDFFVFFFRVLIVVSFSWQNIEVRKDHFVFKPIF